MIHFCDDPMTALCGYPLIVNGNARRFHEEATNSFKDVSCPGCRREITRIKLAPAGWQDPPEWSVPP